MSEMPDQGAGMTPSHKIIFWSFNMLGFIYVGVLVSLSWGLLLVKAGSSHLEWADPLVGYFIVLAWAVFGMISGWLCIAADKKEILFGALGVGCILVTLFWRLLAV